MPERRPMGAPRSPFTSRTVPFGMPLSKRRARHFRKALVKRSGRRSTLVAAFVVTLTCMLAAAAAVARAEDRPDDPWDGKLHVDVTPYIWLPTINGTLRFALSQ